MKLQKAQISILIICVTIFLHLYLFLDFRLWIHDSGLPEPWHFQSYLLIFISFLLSIFMVFFKVIRIPFLGLRFIISILLGYPLGSYLNTEILFTVSIVVEIIFYLPDVYDAIFSFGVIFLTFINQKPATSWGVNFDKADKHDLVFFLFITAFITLLSILLKYVFRHNKMQLINIDRLDYAINKLTQTNLGFQNYVKSVEHDSIERERKRISREMHDIIGYTLTNQLMIIQAALSMKDKIPPEIERLLLQSQEQTRDGMSQARNALYHLREFSPKEKEGVEVILSLINTFKNITGIDIKLDLINVPGSFGEKIDKVLYRFLQEGLTNAFRHGHATKITIMIILDKSTIFASIWDNGNSSGKINEGIGLSGMRERVDSVNGEFSVSALSSGFSVKIRIPYIKEDLGE